MHRGRGSAPRAASWLERCHQRPQEQRKGASHSQNTPELSHNTSIHSIESILFPLNTSFFDTLMRERTLGSTVGAERSRDCQGYHKAREHLTSVRQSITLMVSTRIESSAIPARHRAGWFQRQRGSADSAPHSRRLRETVSQPPDPPELACCPAAITTSRPLAPVRALAWPIRTARVST